MRKNMLQYKNSLKPNARNLRNSATKPENRLWYEYLRNYKFRFNRQRVIGHYIADFYCQKVKLIIEIDGSQHYDVQQEDYDTKRTGYFNSLGIKVIRFTNADIMNNIEGVCEVIDLTVTELSLGLEPTFENRTS
jgi:very-short-patch-repair endonuclease